MNNVFKNIGPTYRATPHKPKLTLSREIEVQVKELINGHSGNGYKVSIGLGRPNGLSVHEEWKAFGPIITEVISAISQNFLIAGLVVGVEMYSKGKGKANTKALKPHAHITILTYNDFLERPIVNLELVFLKQRLDFEVQWLKKSHDITKSITYAVKSGNQDILIKATNHYYGINPVTVVTNQFVQNNPVQELIKVLNRHYGINTVKAQYLMRVPSVGRFNRVVKHQMADFVRKMCLETGITFYKGWLLKRIEKSRYTWDKLAPVEASIALMTSAEGLSVTYKKNMYDSAKWILTEGNSSKSKLNPVQTIFPRMRICPHLWEFKEGNVYNCLKGKLQFEPVLDSFTSCSKYHPYEWEKLPQPTLLVEALKLIIPDEKQQALLLITLGGLFHRLENRKNHKGLWVSGASGTFKTWFIQSFLKANFNTLHVLQVSRTQTRFKYGSLIGAEEGIVFLDYFDSADFRKIAEFMALTDGQTIMIREKYKGSEEVTFKGHPVIISYEPIEKTMYNITDKAALKKRFNQTTFVQTTDLNNQRLYELEILLKEKQIEWVSLAIMANRAFLRSKGERTVQTPNHWTL